MDTRDILKATDVTKRLVQDEEFYKYIFKKTEKIVSVVFYIAYNVNNEEKTKSQIEDILKMARESHDAVLKTLEMRAHTAEEAIRTSAHTLIMLESKLRIAQVSGLISPEVMHLLSSEIDSVLRGMNKYLKLTSAFDDTDYSVSYTPSDRAVPKPKRPRQLTVNTESGVMVREEAKGADRRERIKTVIEAKGEATIKDISDIVTDCSEKTIQRELNSMIEDRVIKRQGERRWSKYSLI